MKIRIITVGELKSPRIIQTPHLYVQVLQDESNLYQTRIVKSICPVWREEFETTTANTNEKFYFKLFDHQSSAFRITKGNNKEVGTASITASKMTIGKHELNLENEQWTVVGRLVLEIED
eukprot:TRINITY_DN12203_c0_g1_i1.p1 TRINITY_DN12203_c0_g1~~TRINITY_DN12203_c0_g1_i1.p1  ORF type:complete len:120 (-),score=20.93 TRINITY_DN12203_c0_g1_i1:113-472(-)